MRNPESQTTTEKPKVLRGREAVPTEAALDAQKKLVMYMTPERIKPYIDFTNEYDPILDALMLRYMDKYDSGEYNGFAEFCETADSGFMQRVINEELKEDDFEALKIALIAHDTYTPFFKDDNDVDEFIQANTH
jgi:hypothetical protein